MPAKTARAASAKAAPGGSFQSRGSDCSLTDSSAKQKKQATRRRAARSAASIYSGRERLGHVQPVDGAYRAIDVNGRIVGTFAHFGDAVAAFDQRDRITGEES
jgi:hypothetical protein